MQFLIYILDLEIKACLSAIPNQRPTFATLLPKLEAILFDDVTMLKLWRRLDRNWKVSWDSFWHEFLDMCGTIPERYSKYEGLFKELLALSDEDIFDRLHRLLYWFSPLSDSTLFDKIVELCKEEWFYGFITSEETPNVLQRSKEGGFLVRFSKTVPVGSYSLVYKYLDYDASELRLAQVRILRRGSTYLIDDEQFRGKKNDSDLIY